MFSIARSSVVARHGIARGITVNARPSFNRGLKLNAAQLGAAKGWGTVFNIFAGAYLGGVIVCCGSLYWLYQDANERQPIPFELRFKDQITAVEAINKDDVLRSPQYAVKHYKKLLTELYLQNSSGQESSEATDSDGSSSFVVPVIPAEVLLKEKSNGFANFYIDIVLRYSRALLSRGQSDASVTMLRKIIDDEEIFYRIGNAESLAQGCRILSRLETDPHVKVAYLMHALDMLTRTHPTLRYDNHYMIQDNSRLTNEFISCLNGLAFAYAKASKSAPKREQQDLLTDSLNIYLANLKMITSVEEKIASNELSERHFPLFTADPLTLKMSIAEIKAHISEIIWAKGYKQNAIGWGEEVVDVVFYEYNNTSRAAPILINTLRNLVNMYGSMKDTVNQERCQRMLTGLEIYEHDPQSWHDTTLARFSKIIYNKGPLGILEKAINERYGAPKPVPNLEEFEELDD
ncbi:hypothetical protein CAAN1_06S03928 [[Candida] anglica]|uniref:Uncharacterized protein n=1 Tax=[Candida] anglica TaxID=148631 RepID=A0ABP0ELA0_9ASCO